MLPRADAGKSSTLKKNRLPARRNPPREGGSNRLSGFLYTGQTPSPPELQDSHTGAASHRRGTDLSRSTHRSATGKSEKDSKHDQPVHPVAHIPCRSPRGYCDQIHPDKQAKNVPARRQRRLAAAGYRLQASGHREKERIEVMFPDPFPSPCGLELVTCGCFASSLVLILSSLRHLNTQTLRHFIFPISLSHRFRSAPPD
jgi:hypothetical protein